MNALLAVLVVAATPSPMISSDAPACTSAVPAAIGGPMPPANVLTVRWFGTTNFEFDYGDQVILLDTFYDRGPRARPIGFTVSQVKRANAILIGHAHWDHISDVAPVAKQTGAKVFGASVTIETAVQLGVPPAQTQAVKSGEILKFKGFSVEAILAQHSTLDPELLKVFTEAIEKATAPTPEQKAAEEQVRAKGTRDPRLIKEGTLAYLFTFPSGFKLIVRNSAGPITEAEKATLKRIGEKTDVAIVPYMGQYVAQRQLAASLPIAKLYNAKVYLPAHHDELLPLFPDIGIEPLLMAIRDSVPGARAYSPLYREPVCFSVAR
jgi:L-ascorbate metabolism protein UlaG (beta-lactamase superfamily)